VAATLQLQSHVVCSSDIILVRVCVLGSRRGHRRSGSPRSAGISCKCDFYCITFLTWFLEDLNFPRPVFAG